MDTEPVPTTSDRPNRAEGDDLADLSYEQARDELVSVVTRLEAGGVTLEDSLTLWERGEALAARCQQWLDGARQRLATARSTEPDEQGDQPGTDPDGPGAAIGASDS
jgi:exodeoxyribonuclease VII small subunit